jgi:predicted GIY-YIG superfamily endonuclease
MNTTELTNKNTYWYTYIAQARTGRYYVGISQGPKKRIEAHNSGIGSQFARDQGPFEIRYISPLFTSKSEARVREIQLKGWSRVKKELLISGEWK